MTRGGARKGAGRKPADVRFTIRLSQAQADKLGRIARARRLLDTEEQPSLVAAVRALVDEAPDPPLRLPR